MKRLSAVILGFSLLGMGVSCRTQAPSFGVSTIQVRPAFTPLPTSNAKPVRASLPLLAGFKSVGDLTVPFYNGQPVHPVFSPDGKWVAAAGASANGGIFLWNVRTRVLTKRLELPAQQLRRLKNLIWSPDGKQIAAWSEDWALSAPLVVWDVSSESVVSLVRNEEFTATSACFLPDGGLLISWVNAADPLLHQSSVSVVQNGQQKVIDLGDRGVVGFIPKRNGPPLALVWTKIGGFSGPDPLLRTSICEWRNDQLSEPLIDFRAREVMLTMALSRNQKVVALSGVVQPHTDTDPTSLYAACNLISRKVLWRNQPAKGITSLEVVFAADDQRFWTPGVVKQQRFETRTGKMTTDLTNIPYFSADGSRAVQSIIPNQVDSNRGQKPYLAAFHLFEKP